MPEPHRQEFRAEESRSHRRGHGCHDPLELPPQVRVGAVLRRGDELLLVRRGHGAAAGTWGLPGAPVRAGETLAEAVVRAVSDQTGVDALCGPFLGWSEDVAADPASLWMCFEAVALAPRLPAGPAEDATAVPDGGGADRSADDGGDPPVVEHEWVHLEVVGERRLDEGLAEFLAEHDVIDLVV